MGVSAKMGVSVQKLTNRGLRSGLRKAGKARFQLIPKPLVDAPQHFGHFSRMSTLLEVEKLAFDLPETQRATLAAHLLESLPPELHDDDEGLAEALRRDGELDANPEIGLSLEALDQRIAGRRA